MRPAKVELWPILGAQGITEPLRPLGVTGDRQGSDLSEGT